LGSGKKISPAGKKMGAKADFALRASGPRFLEEKKAARTGPNGGEVPLISPIAS
jgi:hypothetical protein